MEDFEDDEVDARQADGLDDVEDGWPITDIIEELDDEDNVVSYRLISADDSIGRVQAALEKAGVTGGVGGESKASEEQQQSRTTGSSTEGEQQRNGTKISSKEEKEQQQQQQQQTRTIPSTTTEPADPGPSVKKTVSFSEDGTTQEDPQPEKSFRARRVEQIMHTAKEQEKLSQEAPILPEDEDEEDAALRQEMLKYGMGEIGAVVAELQLEEGDPNDSDYDEGFDEGEEDEDEDEDEDDVEDEYGRNGRVVTDKYRQRMLELEKKLGIEPRSPRAQAVDDGDEKESSDDEGIGRIVVKRGETAGSSTAGQNGTTSKHPPKVSTSAQAKSESDRKKSVRFASSLDIAPEDGSAAPVPKDNLDAEENTQKDKPLVDPLSDIIERSSMTSNNTTTTSKRPPTKKASRFKTARGDADAAAASAVPKGPMDVPAHFADQDRPSAPSGPAGTTIADTLVERKPASAAVPPDEFDGSIAYQEVADEYQKMRRRFIQRQGGFLREDESPVQPVVDEEEEVPMSRFKAARLSRQ